MARPKIPDALKVMRGTDQPVRMSGESDVPVLESVKAPTFLTGDAKKIFEGIAARLCSCRILTAFDIEQLAMYAMNMGRALEAEKMMKKEGAVIIVQTKQGSMQMVSPWFKVQKDCISAASTIAQQFGLTPVSRMRIAQMLQPKKEEEDPFSEFD